MIILKYISKRKSKEDKPKERPIAEIITDRERRALERLKTELEREKHGN